MSKKNKKLTRLILLYILIDFLLFWLIFMPILIFIALIKFGLKTKRIDTYIIEIGWIDDCLKHENILIALIITILIIIAINIIYFTREKWSWW
ncbi:hypothetical protein [Spiroplasma citri]|uniref:hypothetical protein n=1 Tax=Spiroplasma citri TaxID=2133 RepID=UPI0013A07F2F|nr:hypothetical protein [Spiroplasma citri]QIA67092.1 hypothetical protein GMI18_05210 [Spiroplasma citri]QIA67259.1 hypothetical protein GMI18_06205 [Spiroplasma citri]QIA67326.1 hypothetical protein GMI18_06580 [Spiroplasma citri]QIA73197.1 hypothetical protein GL982_05995 [Spiroplasma citri]QIA73391.1 hypothetical protein GL982_07130 [Spiroplasma citri]